MMCRLLLLACLALLANPAILFASATPSCSTVPSTNDDARCVSGYGLHATSWNYAQTTQENIDSQETACTTDNCFDSAAACWCFRKAVDEVNADGFSLAPAGLSCDTHCMTMSRDCDNDFSPFKSDQAQVFSDLGVKCEAHNTESLANEDYSQNFEPAFIVDPTSPNFRRCIGTENIPSDSVNCAGANADAQRICRCGAQAYDECSTDKANPTLVNVENFPGGVFTDSGGPNGNFINRNCWYALEAPASHHVELTVTEWDVPASASIHFRVYDGAHDTDSRIADLTKDFKLADQAAGNYSMFSSGQHLLVQFAQAGSGKGFIAEWDHVADAGPKCARADIDNVFSHQTGNREFLPSSSASQNHSLMVTCSSYYSFMGEQTRTKSLMNWPLQTTSPAQWYPEATLFVQCVNGVFVNATSMWNEPKPLQNVENRCKPVYGTSESLARVFNDASYPSRTFTAVDPQFYPSATYPHDPERTRISSTAGYQFMVIEAPADHYIKLTVNEWVWSHATYDYFQVWDGATTKTQYLVLNRGVNAIPSVGAPRTFFSSGSKLLVQFRFYYASTTNQFSMSWDFRPNGGSCARTDVADQFVYQTGNREFLPSSDADFNHSLVVTCNNNYNIFGEQTRTTMSWPQNLNPVVNSPVFPEASFKLRCANGQFEGTEQFWNGSTTPHTNIDRLCKPVFGTSVPLAQKLNDDTYPAQQYTAVDFQYYLSPTFPNPPTRSLMTSAAATHYLLIEAPSADQYIKLNIDQWVFQHSSYDYFSVYDGPSKGPDQLILHKNIAVPLTTTLDPIFSSGSSLLIVFRFYHASTINMFDFSWEWHANGGSCARADVASLFVHQSGNREFVPSSDSSLNHSLQVTCANNYNYLGEQTRNSMAWPQNLAIPVINPVFPEATFQLRCVDGQFQGQDQFWNASMRPHTNIERLCKPVFGASLGAAQKLNDDTFPDQKYTAVDFQYYLSPTFPNPPTRSLMTNTAATHYLLIQAPNNTNFIQFDVQQWIQHHSTYDNFIVYDGDTTGSSVLTPNGVSQKSSIPGTATLDPIFSSGSSLLIKFRFYYASTINMFDFSWKWHTQKQRCASADWSGLLSNQFYDREFYPDTSVAGRDLVKITCNYEYSFSGEFTTGGWTAMPADKTFYTSCVDGAMSTADIWNSTTNANLEHKCKWLPTAVGTPMLMNSETWPSRTYRTTNNAIRLGNANDLSYYHQPAIVTYFRIQAPPQAYVRLDIERYIEAHSSTYLQVYDGYSNTGTPLLDTLTANIDEPSEAKTIFSSHRDLFIKFYQHVTTSGVDFKWSFINQTQPCDVDNVRHLMWHQYEDRRTVAESTGHYKHNVTLTCDWGYSFSGWYQDWQSTMTVPCGAGGVLDESTIWDVATNANPEHKCKEVCGTEAEPVLLTHDDLPDGIVGNRFQKTTCWFLLEGPPGTAVQINMLGWNFYHSTNTYIEAFNGDSKTDPQAFKFTSSQNGGAALGLHKGTTNRMLIRVYSYYNLNPSTYFFNFDWDFVKLDLTCSGDEVTHCQPNHSLDGTWSGGLDITLPCAGSVLDMSPITPDPCKKICSKDPSNPIVFSDPDNDVFTDGTTTIPAEQDCWYLFSAPFGRYVQLDFLNFELDSNCNDYMKFWSGTDPTDDLKRIGGETCNFENSLQLNSIGQDLLVYFHSDNTDSVLKNGWQATWKTNLQQATPPDLDASVNEPGLVSTQLYFDWSPTQDYSSPALSFQISPVLPPGLNFDQSTGHVSGAVFADEVNTAIVYTVVGFNNHGTGSTQFSFDKDPTATGGAPCTIPCIIIGNGTTACPPPPTCAPGSGMALDSNVNVGGQNVHITLDLAGLGSLCDTSSLESTIAQQSELIDSMSTAVLNMSTHFDWQCSNNVTSPTNASPEVLQTTTIQNLMRFCRLRPQLSAQ